MREYDGLVLEQAANVIRTLYDQKYYKREDLPAVYDRMKFCALSVMHSEAVTSALVFWDHVIQKKLKKCGVEDPDFSTLDQMVIRERLYKVLLKLGTIGCLHVLVTLVLDDVDGAVLEQAVKVAKRLQMVLKQHNILDESRDALFKTCESFSNTQAHIRTALFQFLDLVKCEDLEARVTNRKQWLSNMDSFKSLLDDMLVQYECGEKDKKEEEWEERHKEWTEEEREDAEDPDWREGREEEGEWEEEDEEGWEGEWEGDLQVEPEQWAEGEGIEEECEEEGEEEEGEEEEKEIKKIGTKDGADNKNGADNKKGADNKDGADNKKSADKKNSDDADDVNQLDCY